MSENNDKNRSAYANLAEERESLTLETTETGEVVIKLYYNKKIINPVEFKTKLNMIVNELAKCDKTVADIEQHAFYVQGRAPAKADTMKSEVSENSKQEPSITVKGNNAVEVVKAYKAARDEISQK